MSRHGVVLATPAEMEHSAAVQSSGSACAARAAPNHPGGTLGNGMNSLKYEAPSSLGDAIALLARSSGTSRIMAGNLCNASPAADSVPALIAAGAIARIAGPNGTRDIPVENIPTGPGKTSLAKGEIVVSFLFPQQPSRSGDAYLRMTPRTEMDI